MIPLPPAKNRSYGHGEVGKIRWEVLRYCIGSGFDLGCACYKIHRNAIGVDTAQNWMGTPCTAQLVIDANNLEKFATQQWDFVFSSHTLEDQEDPEKALKEWWRILKPEGHLVLYLPEPSLYLEAMKGDPVGANKHHKKDLLPDDVLAMMRRMSRGWDLLRNEVRDGGPGGDEYSFLQVFRKRNDKVKNEILPVKPEKSACVVRYGGAGDHIMTGAIYPGLKEQGYHITLVTNPHGKELTRGYVEKGLVDDVWLDTASLNDGEMMEYWWYLRKHGGFDRFINMMDSVENVTLPQPTQRIYWLSKGLRDAIHNLNYLETTFAQAELPMPDPPGAVWVATQQEEKWAQEERRKLNGQWVVTLALSGSAIHKATPWWPRVVKLLLEKPDVTVVTIGGPQEATLYNDFEEHPRHIRQAGKWSIREAYAWAQVSDCVLGPETGVLNAVGEGPIAKVLLLSHSAEEQLCKYWQNYTALRQPEGEGCPEQPCHRLHWGWDFCRKDEATGGALCAVSIQPETIAEAVLDWYTRTRRKDAA